MGILDKFNDVSRGVNDKAKNISEANNLKRKILYEEERIVEIFTDISRAVLKTLEKNGYIEFIEKEIERNLFINKNIIQIKITPP